MTGRDIEEQGLARRPSRNENDPVRTARKRIGERLAHCTIYEARPAAERQAHDGDRSVEAFRDFCEAQRRSETGLAGFDGERLCDERYRVVAERKFAMRRLEPRHVKRLAIHFESDRKWTRLNSCHSFASLFPSSS